jgi:hypothetical protein
VRQRRELWVPVFFVLLDGNEIVTLIGHVNDLQEAALQPAHAYRTA